jgi:hypothetical protein
MTKAAATKWMAEVHKKFAKSVAKWSLRAAERLAAAKVEELRLLAKEIADLPKSEDRHAAEENTSVLLAMIKEERTARRQREIKASRDDGAKVAE